MTAATISKSGEGISQHPSRAKGVLSPIQLPLFDAVTTEVQTEPILVIEPVPPSTALGGDRYYFTVYQGFLVWHFPIQWTRSEAERLLIRLKRLDWTLDESLGYPVRIGLIYQTVEALFKGGEA